MTTQHFNEIILWLYLNDKKYPSSNAWRKALVEKLEGMTEGKDSRWHLSPMKDCDKHDDKFKFCPGCFSSCPRCENICKTNNASYDIKPSGGNGIPRIESGDGCTGGAGNVAKVYFSKR